MQGRSWQLGSKTSPFVAEGVGSILTTERVSLPLQPGHGSFSALNLGRPSSAKRAFQPQVFPSAYGHGATRYQAACRGAAIWTASDKSSPGRQLPATREGGCRAGTICPIKIIWKWRLSRRACILWRTSSLRVSPKKAKHLFREQLQRLEGDLRKAKIAFEKRKGRGEKAQLVELRGQKVGDSALLLYATLRERITS